jgi:hypothetical protein
MSYHKEDNVWSVDALKLPTPKGSPVDLAKTGRKRERVQGLFIKGPVPMPWLKQAYEQGGPALYLGNCLWLLRGMRKSDTFVVSNVFLQEHGIKPDAKWRALRKLERAGLVRVERRGKRSPMVTIVLP